jgi:hypothetical protein
MTHRTGRRFAGRLASSNRPAGNGRWLRPLCAGVALALMIALPAASPARAEDNAVKQCFEGPARTLADQAKGDDPVTRHIAEMRAARECSSVAERTIDACLAEIDTSVQDAKHYYPCIGIVANACIDSEFASTEFRKVVCIGAEEQVWINHLHGALGALKGMVKEEERKRLEALEKSFFDYRNMKCELMRTFYKGKGEDVAYGACTTETAARFVIDLREMRARVVATMKAAGGFPATREGAEQLLERFLKPDADFAALTAELKPAPEDYAAVYNKPFADELRKTQGLMWAGGPLIRPRKGQTELKLVFTTTDRLKADSKIRRQFPGGYERVISQMKLDIPIVAFKFVQPGSSSGLAFDGLVYVTGRWVIMPKPWIR